MKDFSELIKTRRSIRQFTEELLDGDAVKLLLRAGLMAPSSKGLHSYEFIVVEDKQMLAALSQCKSVGSDFLAGAPLAIAVLADPAVSDVWVEDCSIATILMQLAAEEMGLGSCWVQIRLRKDSEGGSAEQNVKTLLQLPEHYAVLSILGVGHKERESKPFDEDKMQWEKIHINKYGALRGTRCAIRLYLLLFDLDVCAS